MRKSLSALTALAACLGAAGVHAVPITVDGSTDQFGMFPIVSYGLAEGGDILPAGPNGFALFGLFDTGSTGVAINADGTNFFFGADDATNLGIAGTRTVDVRLNGLGATIQDGPNNILSPIGEPGSTGAAQVQVAGVAVGPEPVGVTLLGAPVANQVAALIDYTAPITRTLSSGPIVAPDITFMQAADAAAFAADVDLELTPFGAIGPNAEGEDRGQRYYLRDVAMNDGTGIAAGTSYDLFWDSGTNVTLIGNTIAAALGLDLGLPDFTGIVGGETLAGFTLDSIVMSGLGGDYTILNAQVFVDTSLVPFGGAADAIIGSNLFNQTSLLFNGPANSLGIGVRGAATVPEPAPWALLLSGLVALFSAPARDRA
jgi:hypothetical protein